MSSTIADLEEERQAVMEWLVAARHQPVHSYRPDSETVRESCLDDIDTCDLYVLILGHRYGFQPADDNPDKLSITHLEFRRAKASSVPRIALLRTSVPDIRLSDLLDPVKAPAVLAFIEEVRREVRPGEFSNLEGLIQGLSTGVQGELDRRTAASASTTRTAADDARIVEVVATLTDELRRKNRLLDESAAENVSLRGRVNELEEQLRAAVTRTIDAAAQPGAGAAAIAAADALEAGNSRPAEALLASQERREAAQIGSPGADDARQRHEAAALAREQGALAMARDVRAALTAFQRAAEYEPDDTWTHFFIGDLHVRRGDLNAAMTAYRKGLAISETRTAREPASTQWQRDHSVSHNKIGDVLVAQGNRSGALAAYRKGLTIIEGLTAHDPTDTDWQHDLSVSHEKMGDVLLGQGEASGALAAYGKALAIRQTLTVRDPTNTHWQRDFSVSHNKVGDALVADGDRSGALAAYRKGLAIAEKLAARDAGNTLWQRDLSISHNRIGTVLLDQGDMAGAVTAYRKAFGISEALAARDPANTEWQRDLSYCLNQLAVWHEQTGDHEDALGFAERSLSISERLATLDPSKVMWQKDVDVSRAQLARLREHLGR